MACVVVDTCTCLYFLLSPPPSPQVLQDVTGEEFEVFMEMLSKLQCLSTAEGAQEVMDIITEQAELGQEFKVQG